MRLIKEDLNTKCFTEEIAVNCIDSHLPSKKDLCQRIKILNPSLEGEGLAAAANKLSSAVRCYMECLAEEFGFSAIDSIDIVEAVLQDMHDEGIEDSDLAAIFMARPRDEELQDPRNQAAHQVGESEPLEFPEEGSTAVKSSEEAPTEEYWKITYRHPTGIYSLAVSEGDRYQAEEVLISRYQPKSWHFSPIGRDEFEELLKKDVPEIKLPTEVESIGDAECPVASEDEIPKAAELDVERELPETPVEELESGLFEEGLDVSVNTDQQSVSVAEKDSKLDIEINSKDGEDAERDAEMELQELSRDPKYAKAFAYLMSTLQVDGESVGSMELELETDPPKGPEESYVAEQLGILIKDEYDAIEGYNKFLQELEANNLGDESDRKVVCDILAEENVHVGQLQELLKRVAPTAENIDVGAEEAQEQLGEEDKRDED